MLGQNFPISDYYKDNIIDARTISRGSVWWTAVLLIKDPRSERPFIALYRWQLSGGQWKTRKRWTIRDKEEYAKLSAVLAEYQSRL